MRYSFTSSASDFPRLRFPLWSLSFVRNSLLKGSNTMIPTIMQITPIGVNEKNDRGSYPASVSASLYDEVGRRTDEGEHSAHAACKRQRHEQSVCACLRFGCEAHDNGHHRGYCARVAYKAPMAAVTTMRSMNRRSSLSPAIDRIFPLIFFASPIWKIAPPTTNRPTIIMTTDWKRIPTGLPEV